MYTGNIGRAQNFEDLIKTIKFVKGNVHWIFVGDGRFKDQFKSLLKKNKILDKTTFIGNIEIDKIPSIATYANSLFLSLKNDEVFSKTVPAKLQTYMALGKPVIAVLKGEGATIIKDSRCGMVEENYNYLKLAENINSFTNQQNDELIKLGENGKTYYENNFKSDLRKQDILKIIYD